MRVAEAAFGAGAIDDPDVLEELYEELDGFVATPDTLRAGAVGLAQASGLFASNSEVRRRDQPGWPDHQRSAHRRSRMPP